MADVQLEAAVQGPEAAEVEVSQVEVSKVDVGETFATNVNLNSSQVDLPEDEDVLSAVYKESGFEIVTRRQSCVENDVQLADKREETERGDSNFDDSANVDGERDTEKGQIVKTAAGQDFEKEEGNETTQRKVFPKPHDPLAKLLDPSPPAKKQSLTKKPLSSSQDVLNKTKKQNLSTESLQSSRIPRASGHLGRSISMFTPRVSSPVPPKGDKTPVKKPVQKIPHLILAQRRPGAVLKRSVSMSIPRKKGTEIAEGMTLVLAVPVTRTSQSVHRSSGGGDGGQPFIISPYQEEHVLAATCPISGITRHIKIIL